MTTGFRIPGNYEATVGIIGAGMIGSMVAEKVLDSLQRMKVIVFDPFLSDERAEKLDVRKCSLEELFETSDVITNHLANNAQTVGMLNYPSVLNDEAVCGIHQHGTRSTGG